MRFISKIKTSPVSFFILLVIVGLIIHVTTTRSEWREKKIIQVDAVYYYAYLPATFIKKDLKLSFMDEADFNQGLVYHRWPGKRKDGKRVIKTTMGLSILWLPFFLIAHLYCSLFGGFEPNGFSVPYHQMISWASIVYSIIGFIFLRKFIKQYFNDWVVAILLLSLFIGSNLYHYTTFETGMSHTYNFALVSIFLLLFSRWENSSSILNSLGLGLIIGLIVLIRPVNILILIIPFMFGVSSLKSLVDRLKLLFKDKLKYLLIVAFFAFLALLPQLMYWKYVSGDWFYFSYGNERFFFNNPHVLEGVFSYRKGWLVYSPIFIFSFIGFIVLFKRSKEWFLSVTIFTVVNLFVVFSWWSWWYGGGFGARALIDSYPIMLIPMGYFFEFILKTKWVKYGVALIVGCFLYYSLEQNVLYREGYVHWGYMTKTTFWKNFLNRGYYDTFWDDLEPFNDAKAMKGEDEYDFDPFKEIN